MRRNIKTTLVALAIVAGMTSGALAQKKWIRLDPVTKDLYRFTYLNDGTCNVRVEVIDQKSTKLLSDQIIEKKSFTKPYNFKNLNHGEYSFKVSDLEGEYVTKVIRTDETYMMAIVKMMDNQKAKVIVRGEFITPVSVNIFDRNNVLVFDDYINREKGFSRVYDLSKIKANELRIEVVAEQKILATAEF